MSKYTPRNRLSVTGTMTKKGADRVGFLLGIAAILAVLLGGIALVIKAAS